MKDKKVLSLMFKKFSISKLKDIILANNSKFINDYAFIEYSKKMQDLNLESSVINNVIDNILFLELKKRKLKQKITNIDINELIKLSAENRMLFCKIAQMIY